MECPECQKCVYFTTSLEKKMFKKGSNKVLNYFCPSCGWVRMFKIPITKKQFKVKEEDDSPVYKT